MMVNKALNNDSSGKLENSSCKLQAWIPPNDRELIIRAKLKTGWSSRCSFNTNNLKTYSSQNTIMTTSAQHTPLISETEFSEIEKVIQRAGLTEKKELARISRLVERYKTLNKPLGDGLTHCYICNCNFGIITSNNYRICSHCLKNVCTTCSFETVCYSKPLPIWLCKICAEYRDFLKKSGLWFNQNMPIRTNGSLSPVMDIESNLNLRPMQSPSQMSISSKKSLDDSKLASSPSTLSSIDDAKNSVLNSDSKYTNLDTDCEQSKYQTVKTSIESSAKIDPESESKMIFEQIAASKHLTASNNIAHNKTELDSLAKAQQSFFSTTALATNLNDDCKSLSSHKFLHKTSTLVTSDSTQNISLAFKNFNIESDSKLGHIQFNVEYIQSLLQLKIILVSATNLPACDSNGLSDPYVKIHLLPGIAKATKLRSKTIYKNLNPRFNEEFHYDGVTLEDLDTKTLRFTVLDEDKFGFDFIGEYRLPLKTLMRNEVNYFNVALEEKQELGDETDTSSRGKINLAVKYSKKTNCLYVKINRCTQLLPMDNGVSSDPFVEVALLPGSKENKQKFRTSTKRKTLDPEFNEEFIFTNIDLKSLLVKTIEVTVWDKDFGSKNDFIGAVKWSQQRTGDELKHFFTIIKNPELYHEKWHTLHMREDKYSTSE